MAITSVGAPVVTQATKGTANSDSVERIRHLAEPARVRQIAEMLPRETTISPNSPHSAATPTIAVPREPNSEDHLERQAVCRMMFSR